jgi:exopolysaccharide production protein ExoQ
MTLSAAFHHLAGGRRKHTRSRSASVFPWTLFLLAWLILFGYQNNLNSNWEDSTQLSDVVDTAQTGNALHQVLAILMGVLGIFVFAKHGKRVRLHGRIASILLAYIGLIALSILWSDDAFVTLRREVALGLLLTFSAGCAARMSEDTLALFTAGLAALNAAAGLVQEFLRGTLHPFAADSRFAGTVGPNVEGAGLSLAIIVAFWFAWRYRGSTRRKSVWAAIALLVLLLMTQSRTSMLGLAAALGASILIITVRKYKHAPGGMAAVLTLIILGSTAAMALLSISGKQLESSGMHLLRTDRDVGEVSDLTGRDLIWDVCLSFASERPILGFGYGGFWTGSRLDTVAYELKWPAFHSHCAYLDVFLELGVVGAALYIVLVLAALVLCAFRFLNFDDRYGAWTAMFVFIAVNGLTESIFVLPTYPAVVFNILLVKLALQPKSQSTEPLTLIG